jgi:hypothetical protein
MLLLKRTEVTKDYCKGEIIKLNQFDIDNATWSGTFLSYSLELGWNDNHVGKSSIPNGVYQIIRHTEGRIWVKEVPNRSEILIHTANYLSQLRGCIAPATKLIHQEGQLPYAERSEDAMNWVRHNMKGVTDTLWVVGPDPTTMVYSSINVNIFIAKIFDSIKNAFLKFHNVVNDYIWERIDIIGEQSRKYYSFLLLLVIVYLLDKLGFLRPIRAHVGRAISSRKNAPKGRYRK